VDNHRSSASPLQANLIDAKTVNSQAFLIVACIFWMYNQAICPTHITRGQMIYHFSHGTGAHLWQ
jgi:hypothetical protein